MSLILERSKLKEKVITIPIKYESKLVVRPKLKEKVITIPIKYEPKLVVRPEYYQRYEIQKLIGLMVSK